MNPHSFLSLIHPTFEEEVLPSDSPYDNIDAFTRHFYPNSPSSVSWQLEELHGYPMFEVPTRAVTPARRSYNTSESSSQLSGSVPEMGSKVSVSVSPPVYDEATFGNDIWYENRALQACQGIVAHPFEAMCANNECYENTENYQAPTTVPKFTGSLLTDLSFTLNKNATEETVLPPDNKPSRKMKPKPLLCKFCYKNKAPEIVYRSHRLTDSRQVIECPILRKYVCPICKATGNGAHTRKYCPYNDFSGMITLPNLNQIRSTPYYYKSNVVYSRDQQNP